MVLSSANLEWEDDLERCGRLFSGGVVACMEWEQESPPLPWDRLPVGSPMRGAAHLPFAGAPPQQPA